MFLVFWALIAIVLCIVILVLVKLFSKPVGNKVYKIKEGFQEEEVINKDIKEEKENQNNG